MYNYSLLDMANSCLAFVLLPLVYNQILRRLEKWFYMRMQRCTKFKVRIRMQGKVSRHHGHHIQYIHHRVIPLTNTRVY